jgi:hypothetical protein
MEFEFIELKELADKLVNLGYEVYVPKPSVSFPKATYLHFGNDCGVAYVQQDNRFSLCQLSSVHIPHRNVGSGYRIENGVHSGSTPDIFSGALTFISQNWDAKNWKFVKKYASITEWLGKHPWHKNNSPLKYKPTKNQ